MYIAQMISRRRSQLVTTGFLVSGALIGLYTVIDRLYVAVFYLWKFSIVPWLG